MKSAKRRPKRDNSDAAALALVDRLWNDVALESVVIFVGAGTTTERSHYGQGLQAHKTESGLSRKLAEPFIPEIDGVLLH